MNKFIKASIIIGVILSLSSCEYEKYDCCDTIEEISDPLDLIEVPPRVVVNPDNDPLTLGIEDCDWSTSVYGKTIDYPITIILPDSLDLSNLMPPVGSQGTQGSCASWATSYYLGSFLKNVENDSIIDTDAEILSPSFAFNQIKEGSGNCYGSSIRENYELMKNLGTLSIDQFPYDMTYCIIQPDSTQLATAQDFKISSYEFIGPYYSDIQPDVIMPVIDEVKSALIDRHPVVVSMLLDTEFGNEYDTVNEIFTVSQTREEIFRGCHAMTIVGYNDRLNAFKLVNSWGEGWANDGFIYVSYNFFKGSEDIDFVPGIRSLSIALRD